MNYTSNLLCHFVGRSLESDDERFELLIKIIKEKQLKANIKTPNNPSLSTDSKYKGENYGEVFRETNCVCFCDIPDDMLEIHTTKYSKFGIGFDKLFLSKQGVRPVMYVPLGGTIKELPPTDSPKSNPMEYFIYLNRLSNNLLPIVTLLNQAIPFNYQMLTLLDKNKDLVEAVKLFDGDVLKGVVDNKTSQMLFSLTTAWATQNAYIKVFDETLEDNDPNNYYMEREWRSLKSIDFELVDIQKVYLPNDEYIEKFKTVFPEYQNSFIVLNN